MLEGCPLKLCTHIISWPPWPLERSNPTPHVTDKETGGSQGEMSVQGSVDRAQAWGGLGARLL